MRPRVLDAAPGAARAMVLAGLSAAISRPLVRRKIPRAGVGVRNTALTVLLTRVWNAITVRREQTTVKPRTTGAVAVTLGALTVEGHGGILAPPATLYAVGTVANPPDPGDPPSQIA